MYKYLDAVALQGKTITKITQVDNDEIHIETDDLKKYRMFHLQDCCESVFIDDVQGDLQSLIGSPLLVSIEEISTDWPKDKTDVKSGESYTFTTYRFETATTKVFVRWYGESNGYYSESVQIEEV